LVLGHSIFKFQTLEKYWHEPLIVLCTLELIFNLKVKHPSTHTLQFTCLVKRILQRFDTSDFPLLGFPHLSLSLKTLLFFLLGGLLYLFAWWWLFLHFFFFWWSSYYGLTPFSLWVNWSCLVRGCFTLLLQAFFKFFVSYS
jgi:hypothetical protein